ncbi:MAG: 50S ribosomal protein L7Ae [Candidatus Marsarchaeota archaeon]|nr:50S ribosomal protein L7Ae [Candidatus Marsarchaeota archaeon]MCL5413110.1 50S ribosomal protein L7Ae [Candidatus Marsarchaeota archaeon]
MSKTPKDVYDKALEAVRLAKASGSVRKGINEVTKSVERNLSSLVLVAEDVEPQEVIMHIPPLCEQKKIALVYVPTKAEIGNAVGINVPCSAVSIEKAGNAEHAIKEVVSKVTGKSQEGKSDATQPQQAAKKEPKPKKEKPAAQTAVQQQKA